VLFSHTGKTFLLLNDFLKYFEDDLDIGFVLSEIFP